MVETVENPKEDLSLSLPRFARWDFLGRVWEEKISALVETLATSFLMLVVVMMMMVLLCSLETPIWTGTAFSLLEKAR